MGCNGNCDQGRHCDCDEGAPISREGIVIVVVVLAAFWVCVAFVLA